MTTLVVKYWKNRWILDPGVQTKTGSKIFQIPDPTKKDPVPYPQDWTHHGHPDREQTVSRDQIMANLNKKDPAHHYL